MSRKPEGSIPVESIPPSFDETGLGDSYRNWYDQRVRQYQNSLTSNSFWQRIGKFFGGRDVAGDANRAALTSLNQDIAQMVENSREDAYNTDAAKAARARAAGLNPDLVGASGADATEFNEVDPPDLTGMAQADNLTPILQGGMQFVTTAIGLLSGVGEVEALSLANGIKKLDMIDKVPNLVSNFLYPDSNLLLDGAALPERYKGKTRAEILADLGPKGDERLSYSEPLDLERWNEFLNSLPRSTRKSLNRVANGYFNSADFKSMSYEKWKSVIEARTGFNKSKASNYYSPDDNDQTVLFRGLVPIFEELTKLQGENNKRYQKKFGEIEGPETEASADQTGASYVTQTKEIEKRLDSTFDTATKFFESIKDSNPIASMLGMFAISYLRTISKQGLSANYRSRTNENGQTASDLSIGF